MDTNEENCTNYLNKITHDWPVVFPSKFSQEHFFDKKRKVGKKGILIMNWDYEKDQNIQI